MEIDQLEAVAPRTRTDRGRLIDELLARTPPADGQWWQIWTDNRWHDLTGRPATAPERSQESERTYEMTIHTGREQHKRPLTGEELAAIRHCIIVAPDTVGLLHDAVLAIYAALLADTGHSLDDLPDGQRLNPADYAIPASQTTAIVDAIIRRAEAWGTSVQVALELVDLMPTSYEDPAVPAPAFGLRDYRPETSTLRVSRDAIDVIAACEAHLHRLAGEYGPGSRLHLDALSSWHQALAGLFSRGGGVNASISKDGPMSLLVTTDSGLVYAMIWHGIVRRCAEQSCAAVIDDDGTTRPTHTGPVVADHTHRPSYPVGGGQPGQWSLHS